LTDHCPRLIFLNFKPYFLDSLLLRRIMVLAFFLKKSKSRKVAKAQRKGQIR
jgi:hypothetical protein